MAAVVLKLSFNDYSNISKNNLKKKPMSRPSLTDKNARITCGGSIMKVIIARKTEVWGLENWLSSLKLKKCYSFFRSWDFDDIMNITERRIFNKFTSEAVFKIMDSVEEVKNQQKILANLKDLFWCPEMDLMHALRELDRVLPSRYDALLGPVSTLFVEVMQCVWFEVHDIKPPSLKNECYYFFYQLCLRAELSNSFMEYDRFNLKKWRVAYQEERKLNKKMAKQLKK